MNVHIVQRVYKLSLPQYLINSAQFYPPPALTDDEVGRGEQQQRRRQQEGQVGRTGEHVGPRRPVAAVTRVHLQIFLEVSIKYF